MSEKLLKGKFTQAMFYPVGEGKFWIEGLIEGHEDFGDGRYIHSSQVVAVNGNEAETLNSRYLFELGPGHEIPAIFG